MIKKIPLYLIIFCFMLSISACSKKIPPPKIGMDASIVVAPFNQPTHDTQLLAGYIPDEQGVLSSDYAANFNAILKDKLSKTNRKYIYLNSADLNMPIQKDSKGRSNSLTSWARLAQKFQTDFILVPQVIDIEERIGDDMYVRRSSRLVCDFYLIKAYNSELESTDEETKDGFLQKRSNYRQIIMPTIENDFGDKLNSRERSDVTYFMNEAINKAIYDFSL